MFNRRITSKRLVRVSGLLFVLVAAISWIAFGLPGVSQRLVHAFGPRVSQVKGLPGAQTKEALTARMTELDETITALKGQLVSNPKNQSLLAQLAAAITEYDQISASMGGDRAPKLGTPPASPPPGPKEAKLDQMQALQNTIASLKLQIAGDPNNQGLKDQLDAAVSELNSLSASMGGDLPSKTSARPLGSSPPAPPGCTATLNSFTNNTPVAIPTGPAVITSTINVAGAGPYLHDLNATTFITHTFNADLDITIQSPSGTIVTLTTDNGGSNDNVFNGTVWDDDANPAGQVPYVTNNGLVTDHAYVNNVVASPLVPEEPLAAFRGENPNGTWTITISDDLAGDGGSLNSWSLDVVTLPAAPTEATTTVSNNTPVAIPTGPAVVTSTVNVAGAGSSITNVTMMTNITHTFNADLDITIQSPSGTVVTLTTDNGGSNDNVFNGTVWDDDANPGGQVPYVTNNGMVTDHAYVNAVAATPLTPEESFGAFIGEDPNGTWTITISDDLAGDGGSLNSWTLNVTTGACGGGPCSCTPQTFSNNTPVAIPTGPAVVTSTINVAGLGTYLYNLKATTFITHTFNADLDITIQSPAGTVVTLTTDNGGSNDDVFNGTVWDDKANPAGQVPYVTNNGMVTDHAYVNGVVATPLVPEEPLAAFIGENPNGTWTITISDDLAGDGGSLNSWSLSPCALQSPPQSVTTTFNNNTPVAIPTGPAVVTSTINAAVGGTQIGNVRLTTNITHTFNADLDITIQSPTGTVVTLTTDNGGSNDNVFAGTLWDDDANPAGQVPYVTNNGMVTDHAYVNNVTATPLTPEESLGAFIGENPTGVWTITISDDLAGDGGSLNSWSLEITTTTCGGGQGCTSITCPANVTQTNDPNQCGAVVTYPAPTPNGSCGTITCSPASGSFFPVGTTTVTCTSSAGPTCQFTVTVTDDQPPSITCPANITKSNDPNQCGAVVNYPPPTITDNCPGTFTATCTPASGSFFPVGTTTVTCTVDGFRGGARPIGKESPTACTTITQSTSQAITPLNSVSCNNGVGHTDNSYWRAFTLSSFGIGGAWDVQSVDIGIEDATSGGVIPGNFASSISAGKPKPKTNAPSGAGQSITVRLWTSSMPFPSGFPGSLTMIGTATVNVPDQSGTIINVPVMGTAPAGSQLVVEIFTPNGEAAGNLFFIGSNAAAETGPSYLSAADCGVPNPTTTAALGFPDMHIVMNVNGCTQAVGTGPSCTFTVTVNDTQPPTITCPGNINVAAAATCPPAGNATVNFTVNAGDNCPGVTVVCTPPSGSIFPVGTTTVNCIATDASGNTASCSFTVTVFTACLRDETIQNNVVMFNAQTGEYRFCCNGVLLATGTGVLNIRGCIGSITDQKGSRRVTIIFDFSATTANNGRGKGTASLLHDNASAFPPCYITDQDMSRHGCTCPMGGPVSGPTKN